MSTHVLSITSLALSLALLTPVSAQDQPGTSKQGADMTAFIGTWELDAARTKLGSLIISYEQSGDGIRVTSPIGAYTFKIDGTDYATAVPGETVSWKQIDKNTLESTTKRNGKVEAVATRVFSPDGKTISMTRKVTGDKPSSITSSLERESGSSGAHPLLGTWRQRRQNMSGAAATVTYTLVPQGLAVRYDGPMADQYTLVFDGKEHAGGSGTPNVNVTARKINDRSFEERWTREGKVFSTSTITVSANGQELTEKQQPGDLQSEPSTMVYRRTQ